MLPTITSPVFSERDLRPSPSGLADTLREIHEVKEFRVVFCLEGSDGVSRAYDKRILTSTIQAELAKGSFNFLPSPPDRYVWSP